MHYTNIKGRACVFMSRWLMRQLSWCKYLEVTSTGSQGQSECRQKIATVLRISQCEYKTRQIQADIRAHTNHGMVLATMAGRDLNCSVRDTGFCTNVVIRRHFKGG